MSSDEWNSEPDNDYLDDSDASNWSPSEEAADEGPVKKAGKKRGRPRMRTKCPGGKVQKLDAAARFALSDKQFETRKNEFLQSIENPSEVKELNGFSIPRYLWDQLKAHQKTGVGWLWRRFVNNEGGILGQSFK